MQVLTESKFRISVLLQVSLFSEENIYDVLFQDMVSTNYRNLIRIIRAIFNKIAIVFWDSLKLEYSYSLGINLWQLNS
jgi:hypothetical protein